jgi:hypothetical protein
VFKVIKFKIFPYERTIGKRKNTPTRPGQVGGFSFFLADHREVRQGSLVRSPDKGNGLQAKFKHKSHLPMRGVLVKKTFTLIKAFLAEKMSSPFPRLNLSRCHGSEEN